MSGRGNPPFHPFLLGWLPWFFNILHTSARSSYCIHTCPVSFWEFMTRLAAPGLVQRAVLAVAALAYRRQLRFAPSADRNKEPIAATLAKYRPFVNAEKRGAVCLEIASGTGQHLSHLAQSFPHVIFQPSEYAGGSSGPEEKAYGDLDPVFASIVAHTGGMANVRKPIELDASAPVWPEPIEAAKFDSIFACNVCHISPFAVTEGLLAGAGRVLEEGGILAVYGPFMVDGAHTADSNAAFDERLRSQDATWGVRCSTRMAGLALERYGLELVAREEMPANNFMLIFRRTM